MEFEAISLAEHAHPYLRQIYEAVASGYKPKKEVTERFVPLDGDGNPLIRPGEDSSLVLAPRIGAVLILLFERSSVPVVALTKRTELVEFHKGEISLPGGAAEPEDASLTDTARRETFEELGTPSEAFQVWGELSPVFIPGSHFLITPFVAYAAEPPSFSPDPFEVAEVLEVPLSHLLDPATIKIEEWETPRGTVRAAFFQYGQHRIWGATARVLAQLASILS